MAAMRKAFCLLLLIALSAIANARVTQDASPRWVMVTYVSAPNSTNQQSIAPWVDGYLIQLHAADTSVGYIATDSTNCVTAPCSQTNTWTTLDSDMTGAGGFTALTCGAWLHNNAGHPCYLGIELTVMSNESTYNKDTPVWVFSQAWATTVGSSVQDSAFCSSYPQNGSASPLAPTSGTANGNTSNCGSGSTACTPATVATGVPAWWETPYMSFVEGWLSQLFAHLKSASYVSQIKYVTISIGVGTENDFTCETIGAVAGTGMESLVSPATDAQLKSTVQTALSNYSAYAAAQRKADGLGFALIFRFAIANALTNGSATDPTWAVSEAANAKNYANTGVGSNGWKNSSAAYGGSDPINLVLAPSACVIANNPTCTSNNWSNAIPSVYGKVAYVISQQCNVSDGGGGASSCDDPSLSGTGAQSDSMWQWFTLAGAAGVNVLEVQLKDVMCIANVSPLSPCASGNAIQLAYQGAAEAWARGQIPINH